MDRSSSVSHDQPGPTSRSSPTSSHSRPVAKSFTSAPPNHGRSKRTINPSVGDARLSEYASHIAPLDTHGASHAISNQAPQLTEDLASDSSPVSLVETPTSSKRANVAASLAPVHIPPPFPYRTHRKSAHSVEVPQQTIMKALASRTGSHGAAPPLTAPHANALNHLKAS